MPSVNYEQFSSGPNSCYVFEPQDDITAYEIAQLLPILTASRKNSTDTAYEMARGIRIPSDSELVRELENLDKNLFRHFKQR